MRHITLKFEVRRFVISIGVLRYIEEFCQHDPASPEGCGILLGYEWGELSEIVAATPPQITDKRSRYGYTRDTQGHLSIAKDLWRKSDGKIGYIGEWHTHPQRVPYPSQRDSNEALKIARKNCSPVLSVILGTTHGCGFMAFDKTISQVKRFRLKPLSLKSSPTS